MPDGLVALTIATALGSALVSGVFFAFSVFVMPALAARPAPEAIAAMQSINVKAVGVGLMGAMFGTAILSLATLVVGIADSGEDYAVYLIVGALIYLLGSIGVTMAFNVPRNNELALQDVDSPAAAEVWQQYLVGWTAWNHVRTVATLAAAVVLLLGL